MVSVVTISALPATSIFGGMVISREKTASSSPCEGRTWRTTVAAASSGFSSRHSRRADNKLTRAAPFPWRMAQVTRCGLANSPADSTINTMANRWIFLI